MSPVVARTQLARFRAIVGRRLGLEFGEHRLDSLADVLRRRLEASERPEPNADAPSPHFDAYLRRLTMGDREELRVLAEQLTVPETSFFRDWEHFRAFTEAVFPSRLVAREDLRTLRILSAGCASGEEAYSLAILVQEHRPELAGWTIEIRGIDVNRGALASARRGQYSAWSLRETPPRLRARYFREHAQEDALVLRDDVRAMVTFEERNLVDDDPPLWEPGAFDVVFCRNVVSHLTPAVARLVMERIHRALAPGGFLFVGRTESLRGISRSFHLRHTHDAFYYRRRDGNDRSAAEPACLPTPPHVAARSAAAAWALHPGRARGAKEGLDLRPAIELLRVERFSDAMDLLGAFPQGAEIDPDAQLLRAALLTNGGRLADAEEVCADLLGQDELNAGAHYLMALCRADAGDIRAAIDHDRCATYLTPDFAMPHLHLGLLARDAGDLEQAQRELARALALLDREDPARIILFGGGFTRETLADLCRSELRACGDGEAW